jgi:hypothetical protein
VARRGHQLDEPSRARLLAAKEQARERVGIVAEDGARRFVQMDDGWRFSSGGDDRRAGGVERREGGIGAYLRRRGFAIEHKPLLPAHIDCASMDVTGALRRRGRGGDCRATGRPAMTTV